MILYSKTNGSNTFGYEYKRSYSLKDLMTYKNVTVEGNNWASGEGKGDTI